jgi:hypothetical protein
MTVVVGITSTGADYDQTGPSPWLGQFAPSSRQSRKLYAAGIPLE